MKDDEKNPFGDETAGSPEGAAANQAGLTLDDLFNEEVDLATADDINRSALSPAGTYQSNPEEAELSASVARVKMKDKDGNETGVERTMVTVVGRVTATIKGEQVSGGVRVRLSPDRIKKNDFETGEATDKDDMASRLWANAVTAYKTHFGESPKNKGQVVEYLTKYPVRFRQIQVGVPTKSNPEPNGEPGNLVVAISPVRAKR